MALRVFSCHLPQRDATDQSPPRASLGPTHQESRPRASGGHPYIEDEFHVEIGSSPRERGSSVRWPAFGPCGGVVPARAGVIRGAWGSPCPRKRRPRARGGHPRPISTRSLSDASSPRERGSSAHPACRDPRIFVVPARAGVIRSCSRRTCCSRCRPRASGGHPTTSTEPVDCSRSSPRERGSSGGCRAPQAGARVVPARAGVIRACRMARDAAMSRPRASGVIRSRGASTIAPRGRPRASGGHPMFSRGLTITMRSSPRERGSSEVSPGIAAPVLVVPARAGVIRLGRCRGSWVRHRPRASGGDPSRLGSRRGSGRSSPRERGSSDLGLPVRGMNIVVPARAGVIRAEHDLGHPRDRRPRASGGHSLGFTGIAQGVGSSPRERRSSAVLPAEQHAAVVVPARAGVIRDSCGRGSNGLWLGSLIERTWQ